MGWFDPDIISFDSDAIASMKKKIDETKTDINNKCKEVMETVEQLQSDWLTPEGQKFLSEIDFDWAKQVDKYVKILDTLSLMLDEAVKLYDELTEKAQQLKF